MPDLDGATRRIDAKVARDADGLAGRSQIVEVDHMLDQTGIVDAGRSAGEHVDAIVVTGSQQQADQPATDKAGGAGAERGGA